MILHCITNGCQSSVQVENRGKDSTYLCAHCSPLDDTNADLAFQEHPFDDELDGFYYVDPDSDSDSEDLFDVMTSLKGFQIHQIRREIKDVPEWARRDDSIQKLLLDAFPKLHINSLQRQRAGRWLRIIRLFYQQGWSEGDIAEELGETTNHVNNTILRMTLVSKGMRADGSGPRRSMR